MDCQGHQQLRIEHQWGLSLINDQLAHTLAPIQLYGLSRENKDCYLKSLTAHFEYMKFHSFDDLNTLL